MLIPKDNTHNFERRKMHYRKMLDFESPTIKEDNAEYFEEESNTKIDREKVRSMSILDSKYEDIESISVHSDVHTHKTSIDIK